MSNKEVYVVALPGVTVRVDWCRAGGARSTRVYQCPSDGASDTTPDDARRDAARARVDTDVTEAGFHYTRHCDMCDAVCETAHCPRCDGAAPAVWEEK